MLNVYGEYKKKFCEKCCGCNYGMTEGIALSDAMNGRDVSTSNITHDQIARCASIRNALK